MSAIHQVDCIWVLLCKFDFIVIHFQLGIWSEFYLNFLWKVSAYLLEIFCPFTALRVQK